MGDKDFAKDNDFQYHLKDDWHVVHGLWIQIKDFIDRKIFTQESWTAPTLLNSWVNSGSGEEPAGYFKDALGIVHLRGNVKSGTVENSDNGTIFILPAGYRPAYKEIFPTPNGAGYYIGLADVLANGRVRAISGPNEWRFLNGIIFRAEG